MITNKNQACFTKKSGCGFQEEVLKKRKGGMRVGSCITSFSRLLLKEVVPVGVTHR